MVGAGTSAKETMSTTEITEIKIYFNDVDYPSRTLNLPAEYALSIYDSLYIVFAQKRSEVALNKGTEEYQDIESSAFCSKCGANVQSDDLYCRKCGIRLT